MVVGVCDDGSVEYHDTFLVVIQEVDAVLLWKEGAGSPSGATCTTHNLERRDGSSDGALGSWSAGAHKVQVLAVCNRR